MWQGWGERRGTCTCLVGKPERKRQLRQSRHRYEDDINMDLQELGRGMDLIDLARVCQAVIKKVINLHI